MAFSSAQYSELLEAFGHLIAERAASEKRLAERDQRLLELAEYAGEELWIIHRPERDPNAGAASDAQYPGTGSLMTRVDEKEAPLPLKHTDVKASVAGYIASVDVTQQFENPYNEKIEAAGLTQDQALSVSMYFSHLNAWILENKYPQ